MKPSPLFLNKMPYDIDVPTPSGGGRIVKKGYYVAGSYYYDTFRQTGLLQLMPADHNYDPKKIVCSYNSDGSEFLWKVQNPEKPFVPTPVVETKEEKAKRGRPKKSSYDELEDSLKEAMAGTGQLLPTASELNELSAEDLRRTAVKVGVPALGNREDLIKALKVKLGG